MILYHGSNMEIDAIDLGKCMPYKDFGRGFYLTTIRKQAEQMARRTARFFGGVPTVTSFRCPDDILTRDDLSARSFGGVTEE